MTDEIPAGKLLLISQGAYSDYTVCSIARLLKPINKEVWDRLIAEFRAESDWAYDAMDKMVPRLIKDGYIEEVEYQELYLGSYGELRTWEEA